MTENLLSKTEYTAKWLSGLVSSGCGLTVGAYKDLMKQTRVFLNSLTDDEVEPSRELFQKYIETVQYMLRDDHRGFFNWYISLINGRCGDFEYWKSEYNKRLMSGKLVDLETFEEEEEENE